MGYVLFILFVAFLVFGIWRATVITLSVQDGRKVDFHLSRGTPFFVVSALIFVFWMSFTTIDAGYCEFSCSPWRLGSSSGVYR